ncbi:N-acetylmuramoyl-L-alanine amidase family protein [Campylobacter anatolicus]|uniref:N-acetylmuramoyl-L-alanine amidase family protein n=1 Tax=Campylobacter anatolicus TaxID=2829105 RepID=UPI001E575185|nr:N-acetylmuramoyl-L-alanine amidase [Campylobacter anatolicus]
MVKITKFLFIFLLAFGVVCGANDKVFANFDKNFATASKAIKKNFHNDIKQIYVNAIIKNNKNLQKQSLERLIKSSHELNLDASGYEADLAKLSKANSTNNTKDKNTRNITKQTDTNNDKKPLYLLSATKGDNELVLKFNKNLNSNWLNISSLNTKENFRNIININGILNGKSLTYKNFIVDEIRIAQFDKSTIRIVFSDKEQKTISADVVDNKLKIGVENFISKETVKTLNKNIKDKNAQNDTLKKQTQITKNTTIKPPTHTKSSKTVVIDPGHGGSDPGAVNGNLKEKIAVLNVGKKLGEILKSRGYKVHYTRTNDTFINLRSRTKFANDKNADLFVSIHANAAPNATKAKSMHGIETFFLSPARSERSKNAAALENKSDIEEMNYFSQQTFLNVLNREKIIASNKLGIDIQREILTGARKVYNASDGGVREAPFWVLVGALMPAVLVEIGYITHPTEGKMLYDDAYQKALATGIANGVDTYFVKNR